MLGREHVGIVQKFLQQFLIPVHAFVRDMDGGLKLRIIDFNPMLIA